MLVLQKLVKYVKYNYNYEYNDHPMCCGRDKFTLINKIKVFDESWDCFGYDGNSIMISAPLSRLFRTPGFVHIKGEIGYDYYKANECDCETSDDDDNSQRIYYDENVCIHSPRLEIESVMGLFDIKYKVGKDWYYVKQLCDTATGTYFTLFSSNSKKPYCDFNFDYIFVFTNSDLPDDYFRKLVPKYTYIEFANKPIGRIYRKHINKV